MLDVLTSIFKKKTQAQATEAPVLDAIQCTYKTYKTCKACNSNIITLRYVFEPKMDLKMWAECSTCGKQGRISSSSSEAMLFWNQDQ